MQRGANLLYGLILRVIHEIIYYECDNPLAEVSFLIKQLSDSKSNNYNRSTFHLYKMHPFPFFPLFVSSNPYLQSGQRHNQTP